MILPMVYGIFYYLKEKEEKKISYGSEFTVKMNKGILLFFFIWMMICFLGMIAAVVLLIALEDPNENQMFWFLEVICLSFFLLGAVGFSICKYNYLVVKDDGIIVKKMFRKSLIIKYSDITYINSNSSALGGVSCFNSDGIPLLSVDHFYVGVEKLDSALRNKGYMLLPNPYPSEDMKKNAKFMKYKKKASLKVGFWCFLCFGILSIGLGILVHNLSHFNEYENYEISGIVDTYEVGDKALKIKLKNDSREYYINNIVYSKLNEKIYDVMSQEDFIILHIGYVDEYKRYNISQIEVDDVVYLNMSDAENREYSNYKMGIITSYVMLGIGGFLIVLSIVYLIRLKKMK